MSGWAARRFWTAAAVVEREDGYGVALDGRPVHTPARNALVVPTRGMAEAIAAEWDAQEGKVAPLTMPVTRSANAALDKVRPQHAEVAEMIGAYGDCDLVCYRATAPAELVARQAEALDPLLDWAATALGARLVRVAGVMHAAQPAPAVACLRDRVAAQDDFALTALHDLVSLSGSLVIGLAAMENHLPAERLWSLSRIEEEWQAGLWGRDDEAERAAEVKRAAFLHALRFDTLRRSG